MNDQNKKTGIETAELLLVELEHIHNTIDLLKQCFIYERKDKETSAMQVLGNHISAVRKEYERYIEGILREKIE